MGFIQGIVNRLGFFFHIQGPDVFDGHDAKKKAFLISQDDGLTDFNGGGKAFRDIQADGNRPEFTGLKAHAVQDRLVINLFHKPF